MKFFFFKKKSSKCPSKKQTTTDSHQKRKTAVASCYPATYPSAPSVQGHIGGNARVQSPSHSISSSSTQSSLDTIQHTQHEEARGIFRTLEPVWSYLPDQDDNQWIPLSSDNQSLLESIYNAKQQSKCTISLNHYPLVPTNEAPAVTISKTNVYFYPNKISPPANISPKKRCKPATHAFTPSTPSFVQHPQQMKSSPNLAISIYDPFPTTLPSTTVLPLPPKPSVISDLYLHQNLRRTLVPYWWFEQDKAHISRFDSKNQVLLEALSEDRSTLTLTDASFPLPFQVILEQTDRSLREECCGFMYLNTPLIPHPSKPVFTYSIIPPKDDASDLHHHDISLSRRCSI